MKPTIYLTVSILIMAAFSGGNAIAQTQNTFIHVARLVIDPGKLEDYKSALKEHAAKAVKLEPGVITLYAVYEKQRPTHVTVFEIYASEEAYQSHLKAPHFLKYKTTVQDMVKSLELVDVTPIALESKCKFPN
jgi:4-carboxymuconolactone decarboxylase